jgi:hypothetical protein
MAKLICHNLLYLASLFIVVMYKWQYSDISSSSFLTLPVVIQIIQIILHERR